MTGWLGYGYSTDRWPLFRRLFRQSRDDRGSGRRVGSVHDFGAGRVDRNGLVLQMCWNILYSGDLQKKRPDAIVPFPMTSGVVGKKVFLVDWKRCMRNQ